MYLGELDQRIIFKNVERDDASAIIGLLSKECNSTDLF